MACINYYPHLAIESSPILAVIFHHIASVPNSTYFIQHTFSSILSSFPLISGVSLQYIYIILSIYISYRILHHLIRFKIVNIFFSKFSHTHYFRRYHAPNVTLKDFKK